MVYLHGGNSDQNSFCFPSEKWIYSKRKEFAPHYENKPIQIIYIETFATKTNENFQMKNFDIFHISTQNIDCGYSLEPPHRGGSNGYPQSMFFSRNKKNNVYYIKVGFKGVKIICFRDARRANSFILE